MRKIKFALFMIYAGITRMPIADVNKKIKNNLPE
jgi:hypothetical protein